MQVNNFVFNLLRENTYVVTGAANRCILIDPAFYTAAEKEEFLSFLRDRSLVPEATILTHAHFDHVFGVKELQDIFDIPVLVSADEKTSLEENRKVSVFGMTPPKTDFRMRHFSDGEALEFAGLRFKVIATPGHSAGSVCFHFEDEGVLFSGDTLFKGTIGRTDFKDSDYDVEMRSIFGRILTLPESTKVYPGHGPSTTIAEEIQTNPFLEPFNEKEEEAGEDATPIILHR